MAVRPELTTWEKLYEKVVSVLPCSDMKHMDV